ncbi:LytR/AlgR family response regulator transcription factor, partial [Fibrella forsythiae]
MNPPYQVIIVDDEPPARAIVEVFVGRVPDLTCVAVCANAHQALDAIQRLKPDLVFLDIQMPEMTGIDLMNLRLPVQPDIILTTAFSEFALKSYEYAVIDYLMKPIAFERFMQAIIKFKDKRLQLSDSVGWTAIETTQSGNAKMTQPDDNSVWLREEKRILQIPYEDILYIEGMKDYVKVYLKNEMIMTHLRIGKAEELFPPPIFVRIHRSHIVRRAAIRSIDGNLIRLINGTELQIGPLYREGLKKFISALR